MRFVLPLHPMYFHGVRVFHEVWEFAFLRQVARFPQFTLLIPPQHSVSDIIRRIEARTSAPPARVNPPE